MDVFQIVKIIILAIVQLVVMNYYVQSQDNKIKGRPYFCKTMTGIFIGTLVLIFIFYGRVDVPLFLAGGLIAAGLFDIPLGIMTNILAVFLAGYTDNIKVEGILYLLVLGTVICLFSETIKNVSSLGYGVVIILSIQLILLLINHNFLLEDTLKVNTLYSLVSSLVIFAFGRLVFYLYQKRTVLLFEEQKESVTEEALRLAEIMNPEFPLLKRLKNTSAALYKHSLFIGEIAGKAAKAAGADEMAAKAGGIYHQIGKLDNKEYIEEGLRLAREYQLPDSIADMIRQHNLKHEKPKTPEAAIVMLTISIVSMLEYLEKDSNGLKGTGNDNLGVSTQKIVENVFQMRLTKGSLDESGLTLKQYNRLKEFFLQM
ncbi:hypothetical protein acsn021_29610 [Anaerocolumna cellulosilytica]|uniref:Uncharacterized protein n=1 Tax=Anaerocolumna cellulosilytica TaxID=433286 RepID=A0A6S6R7R1_9FIRM|nr:HDIG domain-containing metalloprotein [Anaerocolumna cellulosilytica]MBB5197179.1 hypothetical protein [Anaerocolumna cellulosilytica]BCJ95392.1 hypothetical protein acsn021_29610 [Anaerocolumna cellulosilytica]